MNRTIVVYVVVVLLPSRTIGPPYDRALDACMTGTTVRRWSTSPPPGLRKFSHAHLTAASVSERVSPQVAGGRRSGGVRRRRFENNGVLMTMTMIYVRFFSGLYVSECVCTFYVHL